jgi:hypothetical protein
LSIIDIDKNKVQQIYSVLPCYIGQVPLTGLKTPFRDGYVRDLAEEVLKLAKVSKLEYLAMMHYFSPK